MDGRRVHFASADAPLRMTPTAIVSAFVLPAMAAGRPISVEGRVSERWRRGLSRLQETYAAWWGYAPTAVRTDGPDTRDGRPTPGRALCFSGGVDSFYTLLRGERPRHVVYVRGFDMRVDDEARWRPLRRTLDAVRDHLGVEPLVLETNLRDDPLFDGVNWERTHGGALAAVGHLLSERAGTLRIAATLTDAFQPPWGSHPRTDRHWASETLAIEHHGTELWRHEKLWEIQDEPLVRDHLRVCWENRSASGNCSRCDKCLVTMLALLARGRLDRFPVFDPPRSFADALDALPRTTFLRTAALLMEEPELGPLIRTALARLRERTERATGG